MRVNSDDCDAQMPTSDDILGDLKGLRQDLRDAFIPPEITTLAELWINYLRLTTRLEIVMALNYRLKRPPVTMAILEQHDRDIWHCEFSPMTGNCRPGSHCYLGQRDRDEVHIFGK